ncbi:MAG: hypothetical protein Q7V62_00495, partial [Actinomycetota bacterium]|nr:hypothetical protein [Actinomycetota bacterium]
MLWHGGTSEPIDGAALRSAVLDAREARHWATVQRGLAQLYPDAAESLGAALRELVRGHVSARSPQLFVRDLVREAQPAWFQSPAQV